MPTVKYNVINPGTNLEHKSGRGAGNAIKR